MDQVDDRVAAAAVVRWFACFLDVCKLHEATERDVVDRSMSRDDDVRNCG